MAARPAEMPARLAEMSARPAEISARSCVASYFLRVLVFLLWVLARVFPFLTTLSSVYLDKKKTSSTVFWYLLEE